MRKVGDRPRAEDASSRRAAGHDVLRQPGEADALGLLSLSRQAGNAAVSRLLVEAGGRVLPAPATLQRLPCRLNDGPTQEIAHIQQQLNAADASYAEHFRTQGVQPAERLPITGRFSSRTEQAVKQFQSRMPSQETGVVDQHTQTALDKEAPLEQLAGQWTARRPKASARGAFVDAALGWHPRLRVGDTGVAVTELKQRLNTSGLFSYQKVKARATVKNKLNEQDLTFDNATADAVALFQAEQNLDVTREADPRTWSALEAAGKATTGRVEFEWTSVVEGVQGVGMWAKYSWRLEQKRLVVEVGINFTGTPNHPKVDEWLQEIHDIWSVFRAVDVQQPQNKMDIEFQPKRGNDFSVAVVVDPPGMVGRSDAANWHTGDTRRGLGAHEFGHMLGFADEYNRAEEAYIRTTGEEPGVGQVAGGNPDALAQQLHGHLNPLSGDGGTLAAFVRSTFGGRQGGFSRAVSSAYMTRYNADLATTIMNRFNAKGGVYVGFHANKSDAIEPFLYSTQSVMGDMRKVPQTTTQVVLAAHEHPVMPRHVEPFVELIRRATQRPWRAERRQ